MAGTKQERVNEKRFLLAAAAIPIPGQVCVPAAWDGYAPNSIVFFTKLVFGGDHDHTASLSHSQNSASSSPFACIAADCEP